MKRKPTTNTRTLTQIIEGYDLAASARGLSPHTLADYHNTFRKFQAHLGADILFTSITKDQIENFLASLTHLSKKTRLNYHTGLSALWTWAYDLGYTDHHLLRSIQRPKPEKRTILPYTEADLRAMLQAIPRSRAYNDRGTVSSHSLPNQERNRALILLLVDTGLRAEELCTLTIADLDTRNQQIKVFGKGDRERIIPFSSRTGAAIWTYWSAARPDRQPADPAFITETGAPLDRHLLRKQILSIGKRANVSRPSVHRFRHTFAINYLRNGGDVYTLQDILGHATMEMCRTYLHLAHTDARTAHKRASPVMSMHL